MRPYTPGHSRPVCVHFFHIDWRESFVTYNKITSIWFIRSGPALSSPSVIWFRSCGVFLHRSTIYKYFNQPENASKLPSNNIRQVYRQTSDEQIAWKNVHFQLSLWVTKSHTMIPTNETYKFPQKVVYKLSFRALFSLFISCQRCIFKWLLWLYSARSTSVHIK